MSKFSVGFEVVDRVEAGWRTGDASRGEEPGLDEEIGCGERVW